MILVGIVLYTAAGKNEAEIEALRDASPKAFYFFNGAMALALSLADYAVWSYLL